MMSPGDTLSPHPVALAGRTPVISADNYFGLESDHGDDSSRSSTDEFFDLESGEGQGSSTERQEALHPSPSHQMLDGRPELIQKSKTRKGSCDGSNFGIALPLLAWQTSTSKASSIIC